MTARQRKIKRERKKRFAKKIDIVKKILTDALKMAVIAAVALMAAAMVIAFIEYAPPAVKFIAAGYIAYMIVLYLMDKYIITKESAPFDVGASQRAER